MLAKGRYKVRVLAHHVTTTPTTPVQSTAPTPSVATTFTQMPVTRSTATSTLVTAYKLATGQFVEVPYPTARPQDEDIPQPRTPTIHLWKTYPLPQLDRVPLSLAQGQLQKIYLKPEKIGQFPLLQHPHLPPL